MSLWIKRDTELPRHRKTYLLADLLSQGSGSLLPGRDLVAWRAIAMCLLEDVWAYAAEHCPDGSMDAVHPEALKDAVRVWIEGTEWLQTDVRELLIRSGHLDRTEAGLRLHGWLEWTGTDSMRLANDRQRKRLARADASGNRSRTRPHKNEGRGHGKITLEEKRREERNQEESTAAALRALLPAQYVDSLEGHLRASTNPGGVAASIRALGPGGIHEKYSWEVIGRALFELAADRDPTFNARRLDVFCRTLVDRPSPGQGDGAGISGALERLKRTDAA